MKHVLPIPITYNTYLALNVPLQTANRHFTLFRAITLPIRVTFDKFIQYSVDFEYFGLQHTQQSYLLLSEASFNRCTKGSIVICPADIAIQGVTGGTDQTSGGCSLC